MKITILQGAFLPVPPALGGAVEKLWFALGKEFVRRGHSVVHISRTFGDMPEEEKIDGVLHKRIQGYATPSSGVYLKWLDLKYSLRAKSVISPDTQALVTNCFWGPLLLSNFLSARCMVDVQRMPKGQMKLYSKVARLRANSNPVAEAIQKETAYHQHKKICVIPNPLPFCDLPEIDLSAKEPVIVYVGRIHPEKGLHFLLKAAKNLRKDWKLKIIGPSEISSGGGGKKYLDDLKLLNNSSNIEFIDPIYDLETLNRYYAEASIFVYPSVAEKGETFGLAPLEAMAWGAVPIVSNLSCFKDFIEDGVNGLIYDHRAANSAELLKMAIEKLQTDRILWQALAENAIKVQESHSITNIASRFLEEFEKMSNTVKSLQE